MNVKALFLLPLLMTLNGACAPVETKTGAEVKPLTARVLREGLIEGYPAGTKNHEGKASYFESSAVATDGVSAWFTGDKPAPGTTLSSVIKVPLAVLREKSVVPFADVVPIMAPEFRKTQKIESTTVTQDGLRFASTAFDRFTEDSKVADAFNVVVAWRGDAMDKATVLNATTRDEVTSSISLRAPLRRALKDDQWPDGPVYMKIEGLAALPGNRLWFGVRESGKSDTDFTYRFTVLETKWEEKDGLVNLVPEFHKVFEATPEQFTAAGVTGTVGLSSLEYDPARGFVWAVASWEIDDKDGAWLLALTLPSGDQPPRLLPVHDAAGKPVFFTHKVEGLCVVDDHTLLLASDEDRRATVIQTPDGPKTREPNMGVWTLLEVGGK